MNKYKVNIRLSTNGWDFVVIDLTFSCNTSNDAYMAARGIYPEGCILSSEKV